MRQIAASVEGRGGTEAAGLCVVRERSGTRRIFPYLTSRSGKTALQELLQWFDEKCGPAGSAMAFVDASSQVEQIMVTEMGWTRERYFPCRLVWAERHLRKTPYAPPAGVRFELDPPLEVAAKLFVDAFEGQWRWYFSEMLPSGSPPSALCVLGMARKYLGTASQLFVLREYGNPVGISSANYDFRRGLAEFHTGVGVLPIARGRGLGEILARRTVAWAGAQGARSLDVRTQRVPGQRNSNLKTYLGLGGRAGREFALLRAPFRAS
jgi:GNAT superfamily N-acetyltransferase